MEKIDSLVPSGKESKAYLDMLIVFFGKDVSKWPQAWLDIILFYTRIEIHQYLRNQGLYQEKINEYLAYKKNKSKKPL